MRRREFIIGGGAAVAHVLPVVAQQSTIPVIGCLVAASEAQWMGRMAAFRRGLEDGGFVESRNVAILYRWAEGQFDRLPELAAGLLARNVSVIFTTGSAVATQVAMAATRSVPIVFTSGTDPVEAGFVASLNRPGGNVTGVTMISGQLGPKRLELLRELLPTADRVALLVNRNNQITSEADVTGLEEAARRLGLRILVLNGGSEHDLEAAFATAEAQRVAAIQLGNDAYFNSRRAQIAALGLRHRLPTISAEREDVAAGELMAYGANFPALYRQAGVYVARILKGEKPADLPVVLPTKFELIVNLTTAKALGLTIPESFLLRADEVIE
jgi:ABC-type uncharacterized transport system substrate-binding protein